MSARASAFGPLLADDACVGDVVRRAGRPLVVGIVLAVDAEMVLVRWSARALPSESTWHHSATLERRLDGAEIRL